MEEVVKIRSFYATDEEYGAIISFFFPATILFGLLCLIILGITPKRHRKQVNTALMYIEYTIIFIPLFAIYVALNALLLPLALIKTLLHKIVLLCRGVEPARVRIGEFFLFIAFGVFLLFYTYISDIGYFAYRCFSNNGLKTKEEDSDMTVNRACFHTILKAFSEMSKTKVNVTL